ncbi:hypothetical protein Ahy_B03g062162 isoform B [Arachis hypogaea]|uniref:Pinin/SDK/MemA protein domain-containing protein n=1 Tax=Arachis hypogaea TaxID=3818 RepID=A0A444ZT65_ARAHY|nr:hypothetical protein Ahy_B03g062162 isoform B [Arachis hypogaea]
MGSSGTAVEKSEEQLRNEIDELLRQQREIMERLRDPRGLRRGPFSAPRRQPFPPHGDRNEPEGQPPAKRRLSSAVVRVDEEGELIHDDLAHAPKSVNTNGASATNQSNSQHQTGWSRRDRNSNMDSDTPAAEPVPRVLPKNDDPRLVNRNKRMLGQLLGTLEKFRKEDMKLSGTEAYMRRSTSLQRAEQRAREESERLRKEEREQIAEKRRRDLTLRARVAAKTEEKKLELLFLKWSEHHKKLGNFIRLFLILVQKCPYSHFIETKISFSSCALTKTEPPIYYLPKKPLHEDAAIFEKQKEEAFLEWKNARREEVSEYQKQIGEQYLANVEKDMERWQNARKARKVNNNQDLQETMDKELDTHRLEHGPKKRKIPGGSNNEDDEDVEDINIGEEDLMEDVLEDDAGRRVDETTTAEASNPSYDPAVDSDNVDQK